MDNESYEETRLPRDDWAKYLKEGTTCTLVFFNGKVISVEPPSFMDLVVTDTPPGVKGNTASGGARWLCVVVVGGEYGAGLSRAALAEATAPGAPSRRRPQPADPSRPPPPPGHAGGTKTATLETGAVLNVPLFIEVGEMVKIDTRTDTYLSRSKE